MLEQRDMHNKYAYVLVFLRPIQPELFERFLLSMMCYFQVDQYRVLPRAYLRLTVQKSQFHRPNHPEFVHLFSFSILLQKLKFSEKIAIFILFEKHDSWYTSYFIKFTIKRVTVSVEYC